MLNLAEKLILLKQLAATLPESRPGRPVTEGTLLRWHHQGVKGPRHLAGRERIKLEAFRIGGRWYTTDEAFARFVTAQNQPTDPLPVPRSSAIRQRASEAAARRLEAAGI